MCNHRFVPMPIIPANPNDFVVVGWVCHACKMVPPSCFTPTPEATYRAIYN